MHIPFVTDEFQRLERIESRSHLLGCSDDGDRLRPEQATNAHQRAPNFGSRFSANAFGPS